MPRTAPAVAVRATGLARGCKRVEKDFLKIYIFLNSSVYNSVALRRWVAREVLWKAATSLNTALPITHKNVQKFTPNFK